MLTGVEIARGVKSGRARSLVVQNAVDAARCGSEAEGGTGSTAAPAAALATLDRAAGSTVGVLAFDAGDNHIVAVTP